MNTDIGIELLFAGLGVPSWYALMMAFCFGVIIGSFLNVVIYRFHTGKSLNGNSHCLSCGAQLRWFELFPVVSYLYLRGRCRHCGSVIPTRYLWVEVSMGLLFVLLVHTTSDPVLLLLMAVTLAILMVIVVYDIAHMVIPNALTGAVLGCAVLYEAYRYIDGVTAMRIGEDVIAAAAAAGFLWAMWWYSGGAWLGFGDVKLTFPLALMVGVDSVFSMMVISFWVGAGVGLLLLAIQYIRRRGQRHLRFLERTLTMKSEVPFAPFLVAGFLVTFFCQVDVLSLMYHVFAL